MLIFAALAGFVVGTVVGIPIGAVLVFILHPPKGLLH